MLGALTYYRGGHINVRASLLIALGLFLGAYFGARFAQTLTPVVLRRAFALFLAAVAVQLWRTA